MYMYIFNSKINDWVRRRLRTFSNNEPINPAIIRLLLWQIHFITSRIFLLFLISMLTIEEKNIRVFYSAQWWKERQIKKRWQNYAFIIIFHDSLHLLLFRYISMMKVEVYMWMPVDERKNEPPNWEENKLLTIHNSGRPAGH